MDSLRPVMALAAFEARLNLRMIRGWILGTLAALFGFITAAYYLVLHRLFSGYSAPWAFLTADLWVLQSAVMLGIALGLVGVFLAFDWRHRDQAAHFSGTLDASPLTRLQHAWGKFIGLSVAVTWPLLALFVGQIVGMAISGVWLPPIVFIVSFGLYGLPIALAPVAVAFGLAGLVRNQALARALAIVVGVGWIALTFGAGFALPEKFAVVAGTLTELPFYSDFVGYDAGPLTLLQRLANFLQVALFVSLAALGPLGLPRDATERGHRLAITGGLAAAWLACLVGTYAVYTNADGERRATLAAEETARASRSPLRVLRRDVVVKLEPGRRLEGVATLRVRPGGSSWPSHAAFRLNAGLEVVSAKVGGTTVVAERDHTVVRIALPALGAAPDAVIELAYRGIPTARSVDAGAALAEAEMSAQDRNNRRFLGNVPLYFDRKSVVLGIDAGWYPDTALLLGARYPAIERPDLAPGSLVVTLPDGWKAASAGRRGVSGAESTFTSDVPVPGFGLVAAPYEEALADIDGVSVRLLYLKEHRRNVEFFAEAKEALIARAKDRLAAFESATGLKYPHPELNLVEVPQLIGVYASGWDAANRLGQPGIIMLREGQLFRSRFEHAMKSARDKWNERGGGGGRAASGPSAPEASGPSAPDAKPSEEARAAFDSAAAKVDILERFTGTDFTGGDIERLLMRSCWDHRVKPEGEGAALLAVALPAFVAEAALGRYVADTPETARVIQSAANESVQLFAAGRTKEISEVMMKAIAEPDAVWALMQETPLEQLDPAGKPAEFAGVMFVKGRQPFLAVRDALGREAVSAMLRDLLSQAETEPLTWSALRTAILAQADPAQVADLEQLLDAWRLGTELPGFVVERARAFRLPGEVESWQAVAVVSNRGTGPGTARLSLGEGDAAIRRLVSVPLGGSVEVAAVLPTKAERWSLKPYLAMNRTAPTGSLDILESPEWDAPVEVTREAPVSPRPELTVDNVDPGFRVRIDDQVIGWHDRDEKGERRLDRIPVLWRAPGEWRRWAPRSMSPYRPFGYFDESAAVKKGKETAELPASWEIDLPQPGRWRVSAYLPGPKARAGDGVKVASEVTFVVVHAAGEQVVDLKMDAAKRGWNDLGPFDFGASAEVRLLDKGDGVIIADAVRFTKE